MQRLRLDVRNSHVDKIAQLRSAEARVQQSVQEIRQFIKVSTRQNATKSDLDCLGLSIHNSLSAIDHLSREVLILESLYFTSMDERHASFIDAHHQTFDWIFDTAKLPLQDPRSAIALDRWLESKDGLFWVSGKAGSGKSTFMKWLAQEQKTIAALQRWASPAVLCTASFYFWISGWAIQKSQNGLLQSLLHEILSK